MLKKSTAPAARRFEKSASRRKKSSGNSFWKNKKMNDSSTNKLGVVKPQPNKFAPSCLVVLCLLLTSHVSCLSSNRVMARPLRHMEVVSG